MLRNAKKPKNEPNAVNIYYIYILFFIFVIQNETAVTSSIAFTVLVCIICDSNIMKLLLKISKKILKAFYLAIVCDCVIIAVYSVIKCVSLLFLPLLFLLSFVLLCSLLIL